MDPNKATLCVIIILCVTICICWITTCIATVKISNQNNYSAKYEVTDSLESEGK